VELDGLGTDEQDRGDIPVRFALGHEAVRGDTLSGAGG